MRQALLTGIFILAASNSVAQPAAPPSPGGGGPANLCEELAAFMKAPSEKGDAPAKPAAAQDTAKPAEGRPRSPSDADEPRGSSAQTQSAQQASGQDGPAHAAPEPSSAGNGGKAQDAHLKSGLSAPTPTAPTSTPKNSVMSASEVEALAKGNDIAACRQAARKLRIAGVAMPPPLLALAALDLRYHKTGKP